MRLSDRANEFYRGKRVFVRTDVNVPITRGKVIDDYRIRMTIPTIKYLVSRGARVIVASHLGRPDGKVDLTLSMRPVAEKFSQILNMNVRCTDDCIGEKVAEDIESLEDGQVILLENLRFHIEEKINDSNFSRELASFADIYVNDAFGSSHRKHSSVYGMAELFDHRFIGLATEREIKYLNKIRKNPERPFIVIIGGSKIGDKLRALENLVDKADKVLLGGGIAYTFLKAKGINVGSSKVDEKFLDWAVSAMKNNNEKIFLPEDHIVSSDITDKESINTISGDIPSHLKGLDIGPLTSQKYCDIITEDYGTIFWNGPMGVFEIDEFSLGTISLARKLPILKNKGMTTIVGGGDTVSALRKANVKDEDVTHISTGGGASMEFLGGRKLPGLDVLGNERSI